MNINSIKRAFTLVEVLMVLAVIGIASALTIPLIAGNFEEQQDLLTLKKNYNQFESAVQKMMSDTGVSLYYMISARTQYDRADYILRLLENNMKSTQHCGYATLGNCYNDGPIYSTSNTQLNSSIVSYMKSKYAAATVLADGTVLSIYNCLATNKDYAYCEVMIDVNGSAKGPNRFSYDLFNFIVGVNGNLGFEAATTGMSSPEELESDDTIRMTYSSSEYTEWALTFNNMDYKRCANSLNWKTKHSCNGD